MKIENLKIGNTYYISTGRSKGVYHTYTYGKLVEIISKNKVLIEKRNGDKVTYRTDLLHKSPVKAVTSKKAKERVKRELREMEQRKAERLVEKHVARKVNRLGHSTYATIKNEKYIVIGFVGNAPSFDTLEELDKWADEELIKLKERQDAIKARKYRVLKIETKDGNVAYYSKLMFSFGRFEITCRPFKGDISQVDANFILNRDDVPEMKINAKKH